MCVSDTGMGDPSTLVNRFACVLQPTASDIQAPWDWTIFQKFWQDTIDGSNGHPSNFVEQ